MIHLTGDTDTIIRRRCCLCTDLSVSITGNGRHLQTHIGIPSLPCVTEVHSLLQIEACTPSFINHSTFSYRKSVRE